jgi:hypothetical protein
VPDAGRGQQRRDGVRDHEDLFLDALAASTALASRMLLVAV